MHCAAAEGHLAVFEFLIKEPDADLQSATYEGELLEDVVEDDNLRQRVIGKSILPCICIITHPCCLFFLHYPLYFLQSLFDDHAAFRPTD